MREMKKTTIPFCEYIPDKWQVLQNRYLFCNHSVKVGENYNEYQLLSLTTSGVKKKDINASGGKVPTSYYNYQTVSNGDMIFCLFDLDCSAVFSGLSSFEGMITSAYDVFKPEEKYVDKHYIEYWFQYVFSYRYYKMYSKSIRYTITSDMFKAITTPVPPIEEQRRIGEYLDSKCTQIDALISNAQQQIEKLKAYKQSVITETVTKGLDPDVKMKDSGVEWIGEIPEHWKIAKIKIGVTKVGSGKTPLGGAETYSSEGVLFLRSQNIYDEGINLDSPTYITDTIDEEMKGTRVKPYDVLLNITGGSIGRCCIFPPELERANVNQHVSIIRVIDSIFTPDYMHYYWNSNIGKMSISLYQTGGNREGMSADAIKNSPIMVIPIQEQKVITTYLDHKCSQIDKLIALKQQKIEKLQQYKKSLIYEYVTGKKEV